MPNQIRDAGQLDLLFAVLGLFRSVENLLEKFFHGHEVLAVGDPLRRR